MTASHCETKLKKLFGSLILEGLGRNLKTLGELGDKIQLGRRRTNLDENVIGEAVSGCFVISSSDWSVDGSCDVEGDISNGGCHDGRFEVESNKGCARLWDLVTVKTKTKVNVDCRCQRGEAKRLDEQNRQTGCTGPNVNDVMRRVVE